MENVLTNLEVPIEIVGRIQKVVSNFIGYLLGCSFGLVVLSGFYEQVIRIRKFEQNTRMIPVDSTN